MNRPPPGPVRTFASAVAGFAAFLLVWQLSVSFVPFLERVPAPADTARAISQLATGDLLWKSIVASVFRVAWGFCLAVGIGIPLGVLLGWVPTARAVGNPVVQALRPISPIAWLPIAVLLFGRTRWFSAADVEAIFIIFIASFFPIVTATTSAVSSIDHKYIRSAANFGVGGSLLFRRVILPAAMPQILTGLRLALGIAWVVVVAAEMLGVQSGLGYQINDSRNNLRYDLVTAVMAVIAVIGLLLDSAMSRIEHATLARRGARHA